MNSRVDDVDNVIMDLFTVLTTTQMEKIAICMEGCRPEPPPLKLLPLCNTLGYLPILVYCKIYLHKGSPHNFLSRIILNIKLFVFSVHLNAICWYYYVYLILYPLLPFRNILTLRTFVIIIKLITHNICIMTRD